MEEDNITIMVVRQSGKIRTVKIAPKKLYIFIAGLMGLFIAFFTLLYGYIAAYQQNTGLTNSVNAIIEAKINTPEQKSSLLDNPANPNNVSSYTDKSAVPNDSSLIKTSALIAVVTPSKEDVLSEKITIEGFQINITEKPNGLRFYFKLNNMEQGPPLSGYLTVIGGNEKGLPPRYKSYPEREPGKHDEIGDFKQGEWFSIRRFKYVQGFLPFDNQIKGYSKLTLYIYSISGELLYRQTYGIVQTS